MPPRCYREQGQRMTAVIMGCDKVKKRGPEAQKLLESDSRIFPTVEAVKKGGFLRSGQGETGKGQ